jgi:DNA mismatch endonuclease vsr
VTDNHTKEIRSYNMSQIRSKNSKPEETVRKYLFSKGLRFRKNDKRYPGHPDIVLPKYKTIIFVNGCFWHLHDGCRYAVIPSSNVDYWKPKLERNKERDIKIIEELSERGWNVIVVWECQLRKERKQQTLDDLYENIIKKLNA